MPCIRGLSAQVLPKNKTVHEGHDCGFNLDAILVGWTMRINSRVHSADHDVQDLGRPHDEAGGLYGRMRSQNIGTSS